MSGTVTEDRELTGFNRISLGGVGHLSLEPGDQESVRVEASPEVLPYVGTEVKEGKLHIWLKNHGLRPLVGSPGPINYYVTFRELDGVEVSGAGKVTGSGLCAERLDLSISGAGKAKLEVTVGKLRTRISGAGSLRLSGEAARQELTISGAGKYSAAELSSQEGQVSISGAGTSTVNVSDKLSVQISGCGTVRYLGEPELAKRVSGVGKIGPYQGSDS
jgi:hypothetical protein